MKIEKIPFRELPLFHNLIQDYLAESSHIENFISDFPSLEKLSQKAKHRQFHAEKRNLLHSELIKQYQGIDLSSEVNENIDLLLHEKTFTITTGHQLCLATGPLYVIIKIASTIALCNKLNEQNSDLNFIPVFWMASEDHDFDEINHFHVFKNKYQYSTSEKGPVGPMKTNEAWQEIQKSFEDVNQNNSSQKWWNLLKTAYQEKDLSSAFRNLIHELFKNYGLVIIDANSKSLKDSFQSVMMDEIKQMDSSKLIHSTIVEFEKKDYKVQVNPREINLFYIHSNGRDRVVFESGEYKVLNTEIVFENIEEEIQLHAEKFSPNVILRPLYQESILPNIAMIGGGGELSYWMELKELFQERRVEFPLLILRDSVLFIRQKSLDFLSEKEIPFKGLFKNQDEIKKGVARSNHNFNPDKYLEKLSSLYNEIGEEMGEIDQQLKINSEQNKAKASKDFNNLVKRLDRVLKTKSEVELKRLDKIINEIFPDGTFQERRINPCEILLTFDLDLISVLVGNLNPLNKELTLIIN